MPNLGTIYQEGPYTFIAASAIERGFAVKRTANDNEVEECDAQGEASYGVAINKAAAGEPVSVLRRGRYDRAIASAAIALHAQVTVGTTGKYETAATGDLIAGVALNATAADGDEFTIELDTAERVAA